MKHIAVLMGGLSAEREVSLVSGAACAKALEESGYRVSRVDVGPDLAQRLAELKPDAAFNALHGRWGEDGCVQGVLELMHIPYTHSGVLASALAMDKPMAKQLFAAHGLKCPQGVVRSAAELTHGAEPMARPFVVKPANEGSSVGVSIMRDGDNRTLAQLGLNDETLYLIETYIAGQEITVAVLEGRALGVTELRVKSGFYDYENKYTDGKTEHLCPAPLPKAEYDRVMRMAEVAHRALGCRGLTRADFRYDGTEFYLLEVNTQPGFTPLSLSPEIAAHAGISFNQLVSKLVENARLDYAVQPHAAKTAKMGG